MQGFEQHQRGLHGRRTRIVKVRPALLIVRLNERFLFGQCQFKSNVAVQVTVGQVMHHLPDGPTTGSIGSIDLLVGQSLDGSSKLGRRLLYLVNKTASLVCGYFAFPLELSDWVA